MSGYDIKQLMATSTHFFWDESYGQIYPILRQLERDGLAAAVASRSTSTATRGPKARRVYQITAAGRRALQQWLDEPAADELKRIEVLLKLFFGNAAPIGTSVAHVERFREEQRRLLAEYARIERDLTTSHPNDPNRPYWMLTLRYGQRSSSALIAWADETLKTLESMRATRRPRKRSA
jgi:DNA-binding PadR family transcriptional regulator